MDDILKDVILISNERYNELTEHESCKFIGQTRVDKDNMYYMVWEICGVTYKTHNKL